MCDKHGKFISNSHVGKEPTDNTCTGEGPLEQREGDWSDLIGLSDLHNAAGNQCEDHIIYILIFHT